MRIATIVRAVALISCWTGLGGIGEAAITGRVLDADGTAIAGATVEAFEHEDAEPLGLRRVAGTGLTPVATVKSGPDGAFRIEPKRPVSWVHAIADGYAPDVATPDDAPLRLTLKRAALRRGLVTFGGQPVSGALVVWSTMNGGELLSRTDSAGAFEAPDPEVVPGQVAVFHPGYAPQSGFVGSRPDHRLDQALEAGLTLRGQAVDARGRPVAGGVVWVDGSWPLARTDAKGAFTIAHAPASWSSVSVRTPQSIGVVNRKVGPLTVSLKPSRTLSGLVTDAATRLPVAGAVVVVATAEGQRTAETDVRGRYSLASLPAGSYRPYAGRVGYVSGPPNHQRARPIDLRSEPAGRFDVAIARLPQVRGRVVDERGGPLGGAQVSLGFKDTPNLYAWGAWTSFEMSVGEPVVTEPDGTFAMTLPDDDNSGTQFLTADRPLVVLKRGFAAAQAAFDKTGRAPVVVTLSQGIALRGTVRGTDGAPLGGVAVTAAEDGAMGGSLLPTHMVLPHAERRAWVESDAQGRFELRVNPAVHHVYFRKPGYAPRLARGHDPRAEPLEVTLEPAAQVRGRVTRANGKGVAEVAISVRAPSGFGDDTAVTGADGAFEVRDLAPGDYQVVAVHKKLSIHETRSVQAPGPDVDFALGPAVTLRGRVLDSATRHAVPRFDVIVRADKNGEGAWRRAEGDAGDGTFAVEDIPVGAASITVTADGYSERTIEDLELEEDSDPDAVEVLLDADAPIRGRVTGPSGEAIADAVVAAPRGPALRVTVDQEGDYEVRGLPPGEVLLTFSADGYVSEKRTIDSRQSSRLDVTLKRGLALKGVVVQAGGGGVAGAFVSARTSAAHASNESTQTDEQGRFSIEGLVPGRYDVTAQAAGKGTAKQEGVDVEASGPLRLTLDKAGTAVLTGRVVGLPAGEFAMAMVMAQNENNESSQATLDAARTFRMTDAPAGHVSVRAMAASPDAGSSRLSRPVELVLAPGSETETVIEFSDDVTISGVVTRDGAGLPHAVVHFGSQNGAGAMARTDARGAYEAVGLEPGLYRVSVGGERVSYSMRYTVTGSAELDIDVTGGSLTGRVVSADGGAPLDDVVISVYRPGEAENEPETSVTTGNQGTFVQRNLREGRLRLVTSKAGFGQEVRDVELASGGTVDVPIELTPAEGVGVIVVDARDSRPLEAIVVVRDQARRIVANRHSGADENGALNIPLAGGSYLLSTSASGYGTVTLPVTAPAQGLRIGLTPGGTLVIESARDLRGRVRLVQPDGEEYVRCWCNGIAEIQLKGRHTTVENVTPGSYTLEIVDAPQGTRPRPVVVREGQTTTVVIE